MTDIQRTDMRPHSVATGFPSLDRILGGGIRAGDLVVLGGDTGSGKSALALAIAVRTTRSNHEAAFFTCEMTPGRVYERIVAMDRKLSIDTIREMRSAGSDPEVHEGGQSAADNDARPSDPLHGAYPWALTFAPGKSESLLNGIAAHSRLSLAVVDHLQGLATGARALHEELATGLRALKGAALESGTAILLVTHLHDEHGGPLARRPQLEDFGSMGAVRQHADVVLSLFREEMYDDARHISGAAEVHVLKNRHGAPGFVDLYFHKQWLRFEDMIEPDDPGYSPR